MVVVSMAANTCTRATRDNTGTRGASAAPGQACGNESARPRGCSAQRIGDGGAGGVRSGEERVHLRARRHECENHKDVDADAEGKKHKAEEVDTDGIGQKRAGWNHKKHE